MASPGIPGIPKLSSLGVTPQWPLRHRLLAVAIVVVLVGAALSQDAIGVPAYDLFHEGEYLTFAVPSPLSQQAFPLLTHGWLDMLPGRAAHALLPPQYGIFGTRVINALLGAVALALYLACALLLVRPCTVAGWLCVAPTLLFAALFGMNAQSVVILHQAAPCIRDLVLLGVLLCCLVSLQRAFDPVTAGSSAPLMAAAGLAGGISLFWCYDRGLVSAAVLLLTAATLLTRRQHRVAGALALAVFAGCIAAVALTGVFGGVAPHLRNTVYWMHHSEMWAYPLSLALLRHAAPAALLIATLLLLVAHRAWRGCQQRDFGRVATFALLAVMQAGYLKIGFNRADSPHLSWALVPAFLLLPAYLASVYAVAGRRRPHRIRIGGELAAGLLAVLCLVTYPASGTIGRDPLANLRTLLRPPVDDALMPPTIRPVVAALRQVAGPCLYGFTNEGLLYYWSGKPPCSRFFYPAFMVDAVSGEVIADLTRWPPGVIVFDSPFWSARVDGVGVQQRAPSLAAWAAHHYRYERTIDGYVFRADRSEPGFAPVSP